MRLFAAALVAAVLTAAGSAALESREGRVVRPTQKSYAVLLENARAAAPAAGMGLVTDAGPTEVAASRGVKIPGSRVLGVSRNDFAVRILRLSEAAMIEAPIRLDVTENPDGTATLSYRTPSHVLEPYLGDGGSELEAAAKGLDAIFATIAEDAAAE